MHNKLDTKIKTKGGTVVIHLPFHLFFIISLTRCTSLLLAGILNYSILHFLVGYNILSLSIICTERNCTMGLDWLGKYEYFVSKLVKFGNAYAQNYNVERNYDTPIEFSASEVQTMEYILQNEDKNLNMAEVAVRIGLSPSTFSKNVKKMVDKGLLEKYHTSNNRKDIIIRVSEFGLGVYQDYCKYAYTALFGEIFKILDDVPSEYVDRFAEILEISAGATYEMQEPMLIKITDVK